jgi:hypothetical protein
MTSSSGDHADAIVQRLFRASLEVTGALSLAGDQDAVSVCLREVIRASGRVDQGDPGPGPRPRGSRPGTAPLPAAPCPAGGTRGHPPGSQRPGRADRGAPSCARAGGRLTADFGPRRADRSARTWRKSGPSRAGAGYPRRAAHLVPASACCSRHGRESPCRLSLTGPACAHIPAGRGQIALPIRRCSSPVHSRVRVVSLDPGGMNVHRTTVDRLWLRRGLFASSAKEEAVCSAIR